MNKKNITKFFQLALISATALHSLDGLCVVCTANGGGATFSTKEVTVSGNTTSALPTVTVTTISPSCNGATVKDWTWQLGASTPVTILSGASYTPPPFPAINASDLVSACNGKIGDVSLVVNWSWTVSPVGPIPGPIDSNKPSKNSGTAATITAHCNPNCPVGLFQKERDNVNTRFTKFLERYDAGDRAGAMKAINEVDWVKALNDPANPLYSCFSMKAVAVGGGDKFIFNSK